MYWRHFNLTAEPFSLTPDPSFLYLSPVHAEAFAAMTMGLRERRGLITMIGEVGTGKTTLVYSLLSGLGPEIHTAYISNARLSFDGILRLALRDFGVPCESTHNADLLEAFNKFLLDCATQGTTAALVIDEAQNLSQETFEDLRLLSNFETYTHKLLQIVLVGQPELDTKLRDPALRQVAERVAVRCIVNPLTRTQARQCLEHRLAAVNGSLSLFTSAALRLLIARSRGIPRSLNILAHNAMLFAYGEEDTRVVRRYVAAAVHEKDGRELIRLWRRPKGRTTVPAALKQRRDPRSYWALGGAAVAGLSLGLMLAGTQWLTGSSEDAPRRATNRAERQERRANATASANPRAVAEQASNDAPVLVAPVAPTPVVSVPTAPETAPTPEVAVAAPPTSEPAPAAIDVEAPAAPVAEPTAVAVPAEAAPVVVPLLPEPVVAPQPNPETPEIPVVPFAPAPTEAGNEPRATAMPASEPIAAVAPTPAPATDGVEAAVAPPVVEPTPVAPVALVAPPAAITPPTPVTTPAMPLASAAAPSAAAPTVVAAQTPAPAVAAARPAPTPAPARTARAAAPTRERQAAARATTPPPATRTAAARTPARTTPARTPTAPTVAVIPPVAPVPSITPAVAAPLALPGAPENSSLRVAARAVATGEPPPETSEPARQDPGTVVTVPQGSSLSDLMLAVYGQYNSQMMQRVQAVNPQVTDPDFIVAGDRLRFPEKATPPAAPGTEAR